jgi:hypothetical protein
VGVAAELSGIFVDPFDRGDDVGEPGVRVEAVLVEIIGQAQCELAEDSDPVVHGDVDGVRRGGEVLAGEQWFGRGAVDVRPAVQVHHHRALCAAVDHRPAGVRPRHHHIEPEAVLAADPADALVAPLRAVVAGTGRDEDAAPRLARGRPTEPQVTGGLFGVGDAAESDGTVDLVPADGAGGGFDGPGIAAGDAGGDVVRGHVTHHSRITLPM